MGHKNTRDTVSMCNYKERVRLRWRINLQRYSLCLCAYEKEGLLKAKIVASQIELDILSGNIDNTLSRYRLPSEKKQCEVEPKTVIVQPITAIQHFKDWVKKYKDKSCDVHIVYFYLRNTMRKCGGGWGSRNLYRPLKFWIKCE